MLNIILPEPYYKDAQWLINQLILCSFFLQYIGILIYQLNSSLHFSENFEPWLKGFNDEHD